MDDNLLQLAFSIYHKPRAYALLLGSGISRSAGIPTGWAIMETLISQIAVVHNEQVVGKPYDWYQERYREDPTYAKLLKKLGAKPSDRAALLRHFFKPTGDEPATIKPTSAHQAIAKMMKAGFIELVLTTNFDTLLETALEDEHLDPYVIRSGAKAAGAEPLGRHPYTIVKLHGDYIDGEMLNTPEELGKYSRPISQLLKRALSDYGLIICGWSAENDKALHDAMLAAPSRHYMTYWTRYGDRLPPAADEIIQHRKAEIIQINDANEFFTQLENAVNTLHKSFSRHPLSIPGAVEQVKRMLPNPQAGIELDQFIHNTLENAYQRTISNDFYRYLAVQIPQGLSTYDDLSQYFDCYYHEIELALNVVATLCWYGEGQHADQLAHALSRWLEIPQPHNESAYSSIVLLLYTAGIASVARKHWNYLQAILVDPFVSTPYSSSTPHPTFLDRTVDTILKALAGNNPQTANTAQLNVRLSGHLRPIFQQLMPPDNQYQNAFDLFEMLLSLTHRMVEPKPASPRRMPPHISCFSNRSWDYIRIFWQQGGRQQNDWKLLQIEPFANDPLRLQSALAEYVSKVREDQVKMPDGGEKETMPDYAAVYGDALRGGTAWEARLA